MNHLSPNLHSKIDFAARGGANLRFWPNLRFFTEPIVRFGANLGQLHVRFGIVR